MLNKTGTTCISWRTCFSIVRSSRLYIMKQHSPFKQHEEDYENPQSYRSKVRTWDGTSGKICLRIWLNILILENSSVKSSIASLFSRAKHFQAIGTKFFIISLIVCYAAITSFMSKFCPDLDRRSVLFLIWEWMFPITLMCLFFASWRLRCLLSFWYLLLTLFKQFKVSWEVPNYMLNTACLFIECKFW